MDRSECDKSTQGNNNSKTSISCWRKWVGLRVVRGEEWKGQTHRTSSRGRGSWSAPTRTRTWNPLTKSPAMLSQNSRNSALFDSLAAINCHRHQHGQSERALGSRTREKIPGNPWQTPLRTNTGRRPAIATSTAGVPEPRGTFSAPNGTMSSRPPSGAPGRPGSEPSEPVPMTGSED